MDDLATWLLAQLDDEERSVEDDVLPSGEAARVLAEVDAKRRIIDRCAEVIGDRDLRGYDGFGSLADEPNALALFLAVETMRDLALPLAGHPGYRDEWKP